MTNVTLNINLHHMDAYFYTILNEINSQPFKSMKLRSEIHGQNSLSFFSQSHQAKKIVHDVCPFWNIDDNGFWPFFMILPFLRALGLFGLLLLPRGLLLPITEMWICDYEKIWHIHHRNLIFCIYICVPSIACQN